MEGIVPRVELFEGKNGPRLMDMQIFEHIKNKFEKERIRKAQESGYGHGIAAANDEVEDEEIQYIPPLSAYSAASDAPFIPVRNLCKGRMKLSVTEMRYEDFEKRMYSIRKAGWNTLRPIGCRKTMAEIRRERQMRKSDNMDMDQPLERLSGPNTMNYQENLLDPSMQNSAETGNMTDNDNDNDNITENIDINVSTNIPVLVESGNHTIEHSAVDVNNEYYDTNNGNSSTNVGNEVVDEAEGEEEDEISYDYDAEYARVEIDDEEEEGEGDGDRSTYLGAIENSDLATRDPIVQNGINRNLSIQQFVEATSRPRNAYDDIYSEDGDISTYSTADNHLSVGQISSDLHSDGHDFTEIPTVDISDTIDNSDIARSSRVSSLQNRQ
ncbi:hypothetical protein RNJ44_04671 [Nakaseomyces bracarensis]|uniref:Uncharacterized protein n=1 Tax=Nakaseomyces bracarensis TaxID=273131 RepID=A0ABR4NVJ5_9SACH